jgi:hypothetical protein
MGKAFIYGLLIYVGGFILWITQILIPYGKKILIHVQNHANKNTDLDLMYCAKQFLIGFGWTIGLIVCVYVIWFMIAMKVIKN